MNQISNDQTILKVENLTKHFPVRQGRDKKVVKAVDGISFELKAG
jgi:ABC-type oligopeptide transport system ATPase subunit